MVDVGSLDTDTALSVLKHSLPSHVTGPGHADGLSTFIVLVQRGPDFMHSNFALAGWFLLTMFRGPLF